MQSILTAYYEWRRRQRCCPRRTVLVFEDSSWAKFDDLGLDLEVFWP